MKVDLVMWTKNGAATLTQVLARINNVIPEASVNQRLIVDDASTDQTCGIAQSSGWKIIPNEGSGISDGANTALKHVETECFCSFEQDLFLARNWWRQLSGRLQGNVVVCSGMHLLNTDYLRKLEWYGVKRAGPLRGRESASFTLGKTLDNTMYRTKVLREIGGFPTLKAKGGVDTVLAYKLKQKGYTWFVNYDVQSIHLHGGFREELKHYYSYGQQTKAINRAVMRATREKLPVNSRSVVARLLTAPITGLVVAANMHDARIVIAHPLIRLYYLLGLLRSR